WCASERPPRRASATFAFPSSGCGSHTSNTIFESADGLLTPCTRQNVGRLVKGVGGDTASVADVTSVAAVMVVEFSRVSFVRSAQAIGAESRTRDVEPWADRWI